MLIAALSITLFLLQCLFVLVSLAACLTVVVCLLSIRLGVPYVPTRGRLYPSIAKALDITPGDIIYELGSGDGGFSLYLARAHPSAQIVGIELNPLLYALSAIRWRLGGSPKNLAFRRENFFSSDMRRATKVYTYLIPSAMDALLPKLRQELRHTRLASRAFAFKAKPYAEAIRISEQDGLYGQHLLYMYEFTQSTK